MSLLYRFDSSLHFFSLRGVYVNAAVLLHAFCTIVHPASPSVEGDTVTLAAVAPSPSAHDWSRQVGQSSQYQTAMDVSGLMHYNLGISSSAASNNRGMMTSDVDVGIPSYPQAGLGNMMPFASTPYAYGPAAVSHYQQINPGYHGSYVAPNPPRTLSNVNVLTPEVSNIRDPRHAYPQGERTTPMTAKLDERTNYHPQPVPYEPTPESTSAPERKTSSPVSLAAEPVFTTDVDTLMRQIQTKSKQGATQASPVASDSRLPPNGPRSSFGSAYVEQFPNPPVKLVPGMEQQGTSSPKSKKRYECDVPGCGKDFSQKTHLEIHMRAHTGVKPFVSISICVSSQIIRSRN